MMDTIPIAVGQCYTHPRHGTLVVEEVSPNLVRVRPEGADSSFWLKHDDLAPVTAPAHARGRTVPPAVERYLAAVTEPTLVARLQATGYHLWVRVPPDDAVEHTRAAAEYRAWAGEDLPAASVYVRPAGRHYRDDGSLLVFKREWRLHFKADVAGLPFPVMTVGLREGYNTCDEDNQRGLLVNDYIVEVNWVSIIARLVRAGLRVTPIRRNV
jgi:hypothetical protein